MLVTLSLLQCFYATELAVVVDAEDLRATEWKTPELLLNSAAWCEGQEHIMHTTRIVMGYGQSGLCAHGLVGCADVGTAVADALQKRLHTAAVERFAADAKRQFHRREGTGAGGQAADGL